MASNAEDSGSSRLKTGIMGERAKNALFKYLAAGAVFSIVLVLVLIIAVLIEGGWSALTPEFLFTSPREGMTKGGIFPAVVGTAMLVVLMSIIGIPFGTVTAIYLAEYAREDAAISRMIRFAVNTLAGVPAIVFGLFGLGFFIKTLGGGMDSYHSARLTDDLHAVFSEAGSPFAGASEAPLDEVILFLEKRDAERWAEEVERLKALSGAQHVTTITAAETADYLTRTYGPVWGQPSLLWAALTMALLTLPVVIVSVEEAVRSVPRELREASYALGAGKAATILRVILPGSLNGILTGAILAVSRGAGEVAPILFTGAAYYLPDIPTSLNSQFMELGYHVYVLTTQSTNVAATLPLQFATTLVLLALTFALNFTAVVLRAKLRAKRAVAL